MIITFHDMPPNIGDVIHDMQVYVVFRLTLARIQVPGALRTRYKLQKPNAHQNAFAHFRTVPEFTDVD